MSKPITYRPITYHQIKSNHIINILRIQCKHFPFHFFSPSVEKSLTFKLVTRSIFIFLHYVLNIIDLFKGILIHLVYLYIVK